MTNDPRRGFLLADVDARNNIELNNTLDATVQYMSIEYLRRKQVAKPHVVFNFSGINTWELMATNRQQSRGCRVSMDWSGEDDIGELRIKPRSYMDASILATGAFSFPVISQSITIREVIDILRGHHAINREMATYPDVNGFPQYHHLADLTEFDFVQPDPINPSLDGCRDFICQAFIRLCDFGVVSCIGDGITCRSSFLYFDQEIPRVFPSDPSDTRFKFGFWDVAHKDFLPFDADAFEAGTDLRVRIIDLPMHRGTFKDPVFWRKEAMLVHETGEMRLLNYANYSQPRQQ